MSELTLAERVEAAQEEVDAAYRNFQMAETDGAATREDSEEAYEDMVKAQDVLYRLKLAHAPVQTIQMIPVYATVSTDPDNGSFGDCMRCCYATILGLSADQVPHFFENGHEDVDATQQRHWLASKGLGLVQVSYDESSPLISLLGWWEKMFHDTAVILTGTTANSTAHSVVVHRGKIVHDPSGAGIAAPIAGQYHISIFTALPHSVGVPFPPLEGQS